MIKNTNYDKIRTQIQEINANNESFRKLQDIIDKSDAISKIVKKYKEIIPNLQDSVELLGNYQNFKKKGIYQELLIQVKMQ